MCRNKYKEATWYPGAEGNSQRRTKLEGLSLRRAGIQTSLGKVQLSPLDNKEVCLPEPELIGIAGEAEDIPPECRLRIADQQPEALW